MPSKPAARPRLPTAREAGRVADRAPPGERLGALRGAVGNRAIGRLLAGGPPPVGRADAPEERRADRVAERALAGRPAPARAARSRAATRPGLGGGRPLPRAVRRQLAPHVDVDLGRVRLHTGPDVDRAAGALRAEGFSYGPDVFLRRDRADLGTRRGLGVLSHEVAHVDAGRGAPPVLRRKAGLPTAKEAKAATSGSGMGSMFKGEWGTFRGLLTAFRAADDDDKAKQAEVLLKLHTSARAIIDGWRFGDTIKRYVKDQVPKIKLLYWEAAQKETTYDAMHRDAAEHDTRHRAAAGRKIEKKMSRVTSALKQSRAQEINAEREARGEDPVRWWDVELEDAPEAPSVERLVSRLKDAKITVNFPPAALQWSVAEPDMKQFWQLRNDEKAGERKGKDYAKSRQSAEGYLGYAPLMGKDGTVDESLRAHRPIYAGINVFDDPRGAAPGYGRWHFQLKDSIRSRTTFTSGDSLDKIRFALIDGARAHYAGAGDHLAALLVKNDTLLQALVMEEAGTASLGGRSLEFYKGELAASDYIEALVHGGISMSDVEYLVVDVAPPGDAEVLADGDERAPIKAWLARYKDIGAKVKQAT